MHLKFSYSPYQGTLCQPHLHSFPPNQGKHALQFLYKAICSLSDISPFNWFKCLQSSNLKPWAATMSSFLAFTSSVLCAHIHRTPNPSGLFHCLSQLLLPSTTLQSQNLYCLNCFYNKITYLSSLLLNNLPKTQIWSCHSPACQLLNKAQTS